MTTKKQIKQQEAMDLLGYKSLSDIQQKIYNGYRHIINANDVVAVVQFLTREGFTIATSTQQTAELQQEVERLKGLFKSMEDEIAFSDRNSIKESQSTIRGILRLIELAIYNSQQYENGR